MRWILALFAVSLVACSAPPEISGDLPLRTTADGAVVGDIALSVVSVGRTDAARVPARGAWRQAARIERDLGDGAALWWREVRGTGLQFGFDLAQRPLGEGPLRLTMGIDGAAVRVAHDGESATLSEASGSLTHVAGLRAWDAEGRELYARMLSAAPNRLTLHVEDEDAVYPIVVDPVLSSVATVVPGMPGLGARSGYGLAAADVNDDGIDDLLIGEPYFDGAAGSDTGRVQLFLGSAAGVDPAPVWTYEGTSSFERVGKVLAGLGDTDGIGGEDVALGVPEADPGGTSSAGSVLVFYALPTPPWLAPAPDFIASGTTISEGCGGSIADDADFDGDGLGDLAFGCPEGHVTGNASDPGRVVVLFGETGGFTSSTPDELIPGATAEDELGSAVANAGDVNGDGYDDLLVGAEDFESPVFTDDGWVGLYLGSAAGLASAPSQEWLSGQDDSRLGTQLAGGGDVNGDGYADFAMAADSWDGDFTNEGRITVHLGSPQGASPSPAMTWLGGQASAQAGGKEGVASSGGRGVVFGDFDGDGLADVGVAAWRYDGVGTDSGRVEVFAGDADGLAPYPAWTGGGVTALSRSGYAMVAGDIDGDGDADLSLGEWGVGTNDGQVRVLPGPLAGTDSAEVITAGAVGSSFLGGDRARLTGVTMSQDALLTEMEFRLTPSVATPLLFTVYEATSSAGPYTQIAQVPSTGAAGAQWVSSGPSQILLTAGRSYYISTWWQESSTYYNASETLPQPLGSFGTVTGYRTGSGPPPATITGAPFGSVLYPARFTFVPTTDGDGDGAYASADCQDGAAGNGPSGVEVCDGLDNDCDGSADFAGATYEITGATTLASTDFLKGNRLTATEDRLVTRVQAYLASSLGGPISLGIYESAPGTSGPWTLLAEKALVPSTTAPAWHLFDDLDVSLSAGTTYAFVYQWLGGATYYWSSGSPGDPPWGTFVSGISESGSALPGSGSSLVTNPSRYQMRIETSQELDSDGDGSFACLDCDDTDAALFPGQVEACDGADNDCNGLADADAAGEVNVDGDGFLSCAECDDGDAATYPGALEICDGADNDCNGALPPAETDGDGDAVAPCAGDCDDADPDAFPGNIEICDLSDNDCDGIADNDAVVTVAGGTGLVPPTGTMGTTLVTADAVADGVITDVNVLLDVSHTWVGDLEITLSSPGGDSALLAENRGSLGNGYTMTLFDDEAPVSIASGTAPFTGSFSPEEPLSTFDGERLGGAWELELIDEVTSDSGMLNSWSVQAAISGAVDADGDSSTACFDCDEQDAAVFPGAPELCDGSDSNCDGTLPVGEIDADGDGVLVCDGDCDDSAPTVFPGAPELCDGLDNDCDGVVPASEVDADGDGSQVCDGDCDDSRATIYPGATEQCDGWDNDCSGALSAGEADADADLFFVCTFVGSGGNPLYGGGDCNDGSATTYPGAPEICDGIDNNCNGTTTDEGVDTDTDGFTTCTDCNDGNNTVFPGAPELCDARDNDCDGSFGSAEVDADGDLFLACVFVASGGNPVYGGGDCDDATASIYPGAVEVCDGLDTDCSGSPGPTEVDGDGDGSLLCGGDCNDASPATYPGAPEQCDGVDNDCNGSLPANEADGDGDGISLCGGDCDDGAATIYPAAPELCDGLDNDCDGSLPASEADGDSDGQSACEGDCDDANPAVASGIPEVCDGTDNNCDGVLLPTELDGDGDGVAPCEGDCNDAEVSMYPGAAEGCDGLDNDCDGVVPPTEVDADVDGVRVCDGDCDDTVATVFPGAPEACNGVDDDCNPSTSAVGGEGDGDGDGSLACADCDDADPSNAPGADELCDGVDNDCNGLADQDTAGEVDADGDGSLSCVDCEDGIAAVAPGLPEICDGLDNDCDPNTEAAGGESDGDGDGSPACADCDDADGANAPGNPELCDGQDNDCDVSTEASGGELDRASRSRPWTRLPASFDRGTQKGASAERKCQRGYRRCGGSPMSVHTIPTRAPKEYRVLANQQRLGAELGFSRSFTSGLYGSNGGHHG